MTLYNLPSIPLWLTRILIVVALGVSSCTSTPPVTEAEVLGAWQSSERSQAGKSARQILGAPPRHILLYKLGDQLMLHDYLGRYQARLTDAGDSLLLRKGCFLYSTPLRLQRASSSGTDTLRLPLFGRFTRMPEQEYLDAWQAFIDARQIPAASK